MLKQRKCIGFRKYKNRRKSGKQVIRGQWLAGKIPLFKNSVRHAKGFADSAKVRSTDRRLPKGVQKQGDPLSLAKL